VTPGEKLAIECHAEAEYPLEACGGIVTKGSDHRLLPWRNIHDEPHKGFCVHYDDLRQLALLQELGWELRVIYHSHIDAGDHFSQTDKDQALANGRPYYPNVTHVVVSVRKGEVASIASYRWDDSRRDFLKGVFV